MAPTVDNSIWTQMNYVPPRGPCNHKPSLIASACSCKRFMLHPVKALTSFECDGCGHHASFHSLENKIEDAVLKRWEEESRAKGMQDPPERMGKKRRRLVEGPRPAPSAERSLRNVPQHDLVELLEEDID